MQYCWKEREYHKNVQQCYSGTRQILKVEVSNYYTKQKNCISMHLYGYVNILDLSTGLPCSPEGATKLRLLTLNS